MDFEPVQFPDLWFLISTNLLFNCSLQTIKNENINKDYRWKKYKKDCKSKI